MANPNKDPESSPSSQDPFDALVADFGPPSIDTQRALLDTIQKQHVQQWQEAGTLAKLVDIMHIQEGTLSVHAGRHLERRSDDSVITQHFLHVTYNSEKRIGPGTFVSKTSDTYQVARALNDRIIPEPPFDDTDAALITAQMTELEHMKAAGELPDLTDNLEKILAPAYTRFSATGPAKPTL